MDIVRPNPFPIPIYNKSGGSSNLSAAAARSLPIPVPRGRPSPEYDLADEENLSCPSLKRVDRAAALPSISNPPNVSRGVDARPSLASARKASEEARKALVFPFSFFELRIVFAAHLHLSHRLGPAIPLVSLSNIFLSEAMFTLLAEVRTCYPQRILVGCDFQFKHFTLRRWCAFAFILVSSYRSS